MVDVISSANIYVGILMKTLEKQLRFLIKKLPVVEVSMGISMSVEEFYRNDDAFVYLIIH